MRIKKETKNLKKIRFIAITIILIVIGGMVWANGKKLEGFHFFENVMSDGTYTFYVKADQTASYKYAVRRFAKDADYEVYDIKSGERVSEGSIEMLEGYYPFIQMDLEKGKLYKIILSLRHKDTYGFAYVELHKK